MAQQKDLITRDWLAIDRTKMANERTFLAYLRTFIVFLGSGIAIVKVDVLEDLAGLGFFFIAFAPVLLVFGFARFLYVRRHIHKYYRSTEE
jgi:putative membrane protein